MPRSARRRRGAASTLATRASELALAAPVVVAARTARMLAAGHAPTRADRAEMHRMGAEKVEAFAAAWMAMALRWQRLQVEWAMRAWTAPWLLLSPARARRRSLAASARAWRELANAGLAPVHRTATRNARRLSRHHR
jgi:hypothetical protein